MRVWDPLVRLTHWSIALAVVANGLFVEGDVLLHVWIGYAALALLLLRLLWGAVGSDSARFSAFPPGLSATIAHLRAVFAGRHPDYPSHNPLGALMAYALWATLLVVSATGLMLESEPFPEYAAEYATVFAHEDDHEEHSERAAALEDVHETAAVFLLFLAILRLGGVLIETRLSGRGLVRAMISGRGN